MARNDGSLTMEDARILFRNFAGKEGQYNREGERSFCVILDEDIAEQMHRDGWNVKVLKSREEGDPEEPYLHVTVGFKGRPPMIVMLTSKGRTTLSEDEVELLDWVDIAEVDLTVRPYTWSVNGKSGIKAYLKAIYVKIEESILDIKYRDVPDARLALPSGRAPLALDAGEDPNIVDGEIVGE